MLGGLWLAFLVVAGSDGGALRLPGLEVRFPEGERPRAEEIARIFFQETPQIAGRLSLPAPEEIRVVLVGEAEAFVEALGGHDEPRAAAVAFPFEARIVVRLDRLAGRIQTPRAIARHEIVHVLLDGLGLETYRRIPRWFHEGLAQRFAGPLFLGDRGVLVRRARDGTLPSLDSLTSEFPEGAGDQDLAYYLSEAAVREVVGSSESRLPVLWDCLRDGGGFEPCFRTTFETRLDELEAKITSQLIRDKSKLITRVMAWSGLVLFVLGSPLVLLAWWRRKLRAERRLREIEDREIALSSHIESNNTPL